MPTTYLSDLQIAARYGVHRSTPWRWLKTDDIFPAPVSLSPGCTRWKLDDLEAWEAAKRGTAA
ncbi:AlpA family phage regulatory protein [Salipiger sp. 1_MG-2023]|uniref:helix-turn-helix transcriptional regulator n=1 Tax=Salipiger sp. 1_MG-2023 TaxID=3062665 RepID=UPI0026E4438A|nr:AlpA family phage regulatory protein [Salipiger sp. 1_MG-2023]MDO6588295.1 AlpA family phage regulatory protein [Salipiger sp. 1_MG-2023]